MAKASQLIQGRRAIRRVKLPICNAGHLLGGPLPRELAEAQQEAGVSAQDAPDVGLRALTGSEWAEVLRLAAEFEADKASERYELGRMANALLIGCVDPDDPQHGPFFDGGLDQILNSVDLGRDGIAYLFEQLEAWQDETHPQRLTLSIEEMNVAVAELAGEEGSAFRFFTGLRAGMQFRCARFMASLLLNFLGSNSGSGSEKAAPKKSSKTSPTRPKVRGAARKQTGRGRR